MPGGLWLWLLPSGPSSYFRFQVRNGPDWSYWRRPGPLRWRKKSICWLRYFETIFVFLPVVSSLKPECLCLCWLLTGLDILSTGNCWWSELTHPFPSPRQCPWSLLLEGWFSGSSLRLLPWAIGKSNSALLREFRSEPHGLDAGFSCCVHEAGVRVYPKQGGWGCSGSHSTRVEDIFTQVRFYFIYHVDKPIEHSNYTNFFHFCPLSVLKLVRDTGTWLMTLALLALFVVLGMSWRWIWWEAEVMGGRFWQLPEELPWVFC